MIEKKARIIKAYYVENVDKVVWECELEDGTYHSLEWPRIHYGPQLGINADIPVGIIEDHLPDMVGKDFTLKFADILDDVDTDQISGMMSKFVNDYLGDSDVEPS